MAYGHLKVRPMAITVRFGTRASTALYLQYSSYSTVATL